MPRPPDLSQKQLPLYVARPGHRFVRVHTSGREPLFFGPAPGSAPSGRWDSPDHGFGACYVAEASQPHVAFAERFLRDARRTLISEAELRRAAVSVVRVEKQIRIVAFHGASLKRLGASAAIARGDHREARLWSRALHDHRGAPDGIRWRSRVDDDGFAVVLFDRSRQALKVKETEPLLESRVLDIEACLERYAAAVVEDRDW